MTTNGFCNKAKAYALDSKLRLIIQDQLKLKVKSKALVKFVLEA